MITQRNPVHAALCFALVVLSTCGLFLLQAAPFLMAATIIIYAGAIVVTFLFVIMLAQQAGLSNADQRSREPLLATLAGFVLLGSSALRSGQDLRQHYGVPIDNYIEQTRRVQGRISDKSGNRFLAKMEHSLRALPNLRVQRENAIRMIRCGPPSKRDPRCSPNVEYSCDSRKTTNGCSPEGSAAVSSRANWPNYGKRRCERATIRAVSFAEQGCLCRQHPVRLRISWRRCRRR